MPAAIKRRKTTATTKNASSSAKKPRGLDAFTTVSKASALGKVVGEKNNVVDGQLARRVTTGSKRKVEVVDFENAEEVISVSDIFRATIKVEEREIKPLPQRRSEASPSKSSSKVASIFTKACAKAKTASTTPELPSELLDLINLHAAFLTALSLHYAHNGTNTPADLRLLCPDVARAWGKRRVLIEDIRRTLGVLNKHMPSETTDQPPLSRLTLSNYGLGKICVEIETASGKAGHMARAVNEDLLNEIFARGLAKMWEQREGEIEVEDFVKGLVLEEITVCESFAKMSPLLAKGQRRLEDLRKGAITKKEEAKQKKLATKEVNSTKPTLLERLRAKQILAASLPAPLNKVQLSRVAALHRIDEVASVLGMLTTSTSVGQTRVSFTLPTVLGKLMDSTRMPMSKEEGEACVRLLAGEIAPGWVKLVKMGKVEALVVNRDGRPTELALKESVKRASSML